MLEKDFAPRGAWINYRNWKGRLARRYIQPHTLIFGKSRWHNEEQWLLVARDLEEHKVKTFAMSGILCWSTTPEGLPPLPEEPAPPWEETRAVVIEENVGDPLVPLVAEGEPS